KLVENLERKDPAVNRVRVGQVLKTATRLFTKRGYEAASIRDLAAELAIRPSSLYHHFPGEAGQPVHDLLRDAGGLHRPGAAEARLRNARGGDPPHHPRARPVQPA